MARILVIDDDRAILEMAGSALKARGHAVEIAVNGRVGLRALGAERFDLVITDMLMPEMDGLETIRAIKGFDPATKVLAITGGGAVDHGDLLNIAAKLGADGALFKPFQPSALLATVELMLNPRAAAGSPALAAAPMRRQPSVRHAFRF